jgi:curved DNA-binding protein CbpA
MEEVLRAYASSRPSNKDKSHTRSAHFGNQKDHPRTPTLKEKFKEIGDHFRTLGDEVRRMQRE